MKQFRLLRPDEIECRVSQCNKTGAALLLYKTARTDADLLDETVGAARWENDFKLVDGVLYGGIGIDYDGNGNLIWKWDAGTESNTEAEKGRASDAFKRAGFKHGIGRELYSAPRVWIASENCAKLTQNNGKWQCRDNFSVGDIKYDDDGKISYLAILAGRKTVFRWCKNENDAYTTADKESPAEEPPSVEATDTPARYICTECGGEILASVYDGTSFEPRVIAGHTINKYGYALCWNCYMKRQFADTAKTANV